MSTPSIATTARRQAHLQRLASENAALRRRLADAENPAQPVPEQGDEGASASTDETRAADTTTEVTTPGGVMPAPAADAAADVTTPGGVIPAVPAPSFDVEAPVAGGTDIPVPDVRTEVDINFDAETLADPAFDDGTWVTATAAQRRQAYADQIRQRIWSSLRLARMRRQAGIASGDELQLAMQIEASSLGDSDIRTEIDTLARVAQVRPQARQQQRTASEARTAPSLAGGRPSVPQMAQVPSMSPTADEFAFEA